MILDLLRVPAASVASFTSTPTPGHSMVPAPLPGTSDFCLPGRLLSLPGYGPAHAALGGLTRYQMQFIAHRGFAGRFVQNTAPAFRGAILLGATDIEADVQVSSDGTLWCYHDADLSTLTSGTGSVASRTDAYLDGVRMTANPALPLCRFAEFLAICAAAAVRISVETKAYRTQADVNLVVDAIVAAGLAPRATVASFTLSDLTVARARNATIRVQHIIQSVTEAQVTTAIAAVAAVGLPADIAVERTAAGATATSMSNAKASGLKAVTWTSTSIATATPSLIIGADAIYADKPLWDV